MAALVPLLFSHLTWVLPPSHRFPAQGDAPVSAMLRSMARSLELPRLPAQARGGGWGEWGGGGGDATVLS